MRISTFRDDALGDMDAVAMREALASGSVSAEELRQAALARAEAAAELNAVVSWVAPQAEVAGEFAGIPTFVKDNEDVAGHPTTFGSRATPRDPARASSRFVKHWEQLGLQTLGKSALPEFGLTATTEPLAHGPTRNPWGLAHTTGGSSGGSAAMVAAGVVPLAHANDGGGSIRIPASCCGLVGLKPSRGRLIDAEAMDMMPVNIVTQGVLTRSVRDTVEFYRAMGKVHPVNHLPPIGPTGDPGRLRIGVLADGLAGIPVDPQVRAAVTEAALLCERLGHDVEEIDNPFGDRVAHDFLRYWAMLAFSLRRLGKQAFGKGYEPSRLEPFTLYLAGFFSTVAAGLPVSLRRLQRFGHVYDEGFGRFDLLLSPVLAQPPLPIGHIGPQVPPREHLVRLLQFASFTAMQNVAGTPGISVPLGASSDGLPIGVHFGARLGQEQMLLDLAAALEQAQPWPRVDRG